MLTAWFVISKDCGSVTMVLQDNMRVLLTFKQRQHDGYPVCTKYTV